MTPLGRFNISASGIFVFPYFVVSLRKNSILYCITRLERDDGSDSVMKYTYFSGVFFFFFKTLIFAVMQETCSGLIPGPGRSPGGGHSNPLQCSCPENFLNRGVWWVIVHGVAESDTTEWLTLSFSLWRWISRQSLVWKTNIYFLPVPGKCSWF